MTALPAWPANELVHEVVVVPRDAYLPMPDLQLVDRPGWRQLITPSFRTGGLNEVSCAVLDPATADAAIADAIAGYAALGIRFRWIVGPDSAPADLAARLAAHGLTRSEVCGMARATAPAPPLVHPADPALEVHEIDEAELDAYTAAMAAGWDTDPVPLRRANAVALAQPAHHLYLATLDGEPAGTASSVHFARSAYLLGAVTLPAHRRRGVYAGLVHARLAAASRAGLALATSHARAATSAPRLAALGFTEVLRWPSFTG